MSDDFKKNNLLRCNRSLIVDNIVYYFHFLKNHRSEALQLVIDEAGLIDAGKYVCVAQNIAGKRESSINIVLTSAPKIVRHPSSKSPLEGDDVYFDCKTEVIVLYSIIIAIPFLNLGIALSGYINRMGNRW